MVCEAGVLKYRPALIHTPKVKVVSLLSDFEDLGVNLITFIRYGWLQQNQLSNDIFVIVIK